jgi:hypothetical protein
MRTTTQWSAFVAGILISVPHSAVCQKTPNENLVLADCGIGLGHNGGSTSREMMYYSGDVWTGNGDATNKPTHMVNVPWTGAYPWGPQGVKAKMPNGDEWSVYINDKIKDPNSAGDAWHSYELDKPLKCYSYHVDKVYKLDDGKWCSSAYVCNHRGKPRPGSSSGGGGGGGGDKDKIRITGSTNSDFVELYEQTPEHVMATVKKTFSSTSINCDSTPISLGSKCTISWKCHGEPGLKALDKMSAAYDSMAAEPKFSSKRQSTTQVCRTPDTRPGKEGQCLRWETKVDNYVKVPKTLDLIMDNIPSDGSNPNVHGWMNYEISCDRTSKECIICKAIGGALRIASNAAGATVLLGCKANGC